MTFIQAHERIKNALQMAIQYGGIDGAHHKQWTIDQMVRCLTGCEIEDEEGYLNIVGESEEYKKLIAEACDGEDGPNTYEWDCGIAP